MLYWRRIWIKIMAILLALLMTAKIFVRPVSKLLVWVIDRQVNLNLIVSPTTLLKISNELYLFADKLTKISTTILMLVLVILTIWVIIDIFNGQLKLDYYSIQLGKHLQRSQINNLQMVKDEQDKANYWLKWLRIVCWRHRLYVLIPCGSNAAVEDIIKERCDNYTIGWLNLTIKNSNWINKINQYNRLHSNWLVLKEK